MLKCLVLLIAITWVSCNTFSVLPQSVIYIPSQGISVLSEESQFVLTGNENLRYGLAEKPKVKEDVLANHLNKDTLERILGTYILDLVKHAQGAAPTTISNEFSARSNVDQPSAAKPLEKDSLENTLGNYVLYLISRAQNGARINLEN